MDFNLKDGTHNIINLSDETRGICKGYADGLNYYMEKNKDHIKQYIYPVYGEDIARGFLYKNPVLHSTYFA